MFGYVIIDKPNILIKDYQTYRSYYCGLCKSIGKRSGQAMRLTLNYDIVVLALIAHNYENKTPEFSKGRCFVHPLRGISYVKHNNILAKIADINTILGYYKIYDDVVDEGKHKLLKTALTPYFKKARKRLPELSKQVGEIYDKLRAYEKQKADENVLSDCFGSLMIKVGECLTEKCDNHLREMCFYLGKWVYVIDAFDDLQKDFEKNNYNPFLRDVTKWDDRIFENVATRFTWITNECIDKIISVYEMMQINVSEGTLSNIIYKGLPARTEFVLNKRGKKCQKIRL
ncbi:MAG: hypothetical protein GX242_04615 [Clostridiales bacterium]|nr:hypothetical protein [Clostridiales bacterium]